MENKINPCAIWNISKSEFIKWLINPRMIIVGIMLVFRTHRIYADRPKCY